MKKFSLLIAVALATFILTACSSSPKTEPTPSSDATGSGVSKSAPIDPVATSGVVPTRTATKRRTTPPAAPKLITIQNFEFNPSSLTVNKGDIVKWVNKDQMPHTVSADAFQSGLIQTGQFFTYQFETAGNYPYACKIHPAMKGAIIVKP